MTHHFRTWDEMQTRVDARREVLELLDHEAGEWRSASALLLAAATAANIKAAATDSNTDKRFAEACVRVAKTLTELRD